MTNLPFTGKIQVTCEFGVKGDWQAGFHTGIDLIGLDNKTVYSTHNGWVIFTGTSGAYGKIVKIKDINGYIHLYAHLASISVKQGQSVNRTTKIGIMGDTGNVTGPHLHYEIRNSSGEYGDVINPVAHLGIPNKKNTIINSKDYQLTEEKTIEKKELELKTLARNTNLRDKPTTQGSIATLYLANTTLYVLEKNVAEADGYIWDKVKIRVNSQEGYMINKNYK